jgi:8-oxo-dGTP diphosphatase
MNKPVIIFDLFGVIFTKGLKSSINKLSSIYNLPKRLISKSYRKWEIPFDKGLINSKEFWKNVNDDLGKDVNYKILNDIVLSSYNILPDTIKLVEFLNKYFTLVVYSNYRNEWFKVLDERYRISELFEIVFISSEVGEVKPFYSAFNHIESSLAVSKKDLCLIDDNKSNTSSFKKWGGQSIQFTDIYTTELALRNMYQDFLPHYKEYYSGIFLFNPDDTIIFQKRDNKKNIDNPNMLSVFGGRSKPSETPIECAVRELYEETSLKANKNNLKKIIELSYPIKYDNWIHCTYYKYEKFDISNFVLNEGQGIEILTAKKASRSSNITEIPKYILENVIKPVANNV